MRILQNCGKMEVRESPIEGFGVFAKEDIKAGTVIEEAPLIMFPRHTVLAKTIFDALKSNGWTNPKELYMENLKNNLGFKDPERYFFKWHPRHILDGDGQYTVLPLGFGPIYNTSNTNNNADWKMLKDTFLFQAEKDIAKESEITTFYGYFLGEEGTTFNCDMVFHMAIDMFRFEAGLEHRVKMLRFGSIETLNAQRSNPAAHKIHTLFLKANGEGLKINRIILTNNNDEVTVNYEVAADMPISALYQRLIEAKAHPSPNVKFQFRYISKITGNQEVEEILWKK